MTRYRFGPFTLSPQRRQLVRQGQEIALIPRYFDLLLLLVERRQQAVHRREIFDLVWSGVIVSDSALSQAIRTLRRTLDDDPKEPTFIRTVSRHGYQFVCADVTEEPDDQPSAAVTASPAVVEHGWRSAVRVALRRSGDAAGGGALAGMAAGALGGLLLAVSPGSTAPLALTPVLAVIGGLCGAVAAAGVGGAVALSDDSPIAPRPLAFALGGAVGGMAVGGFVQWVSMMGLSALFGLALEVGGAAEGVVIGAAAGVGYAASAGRTRGQAAIIMAGCAGLSGLLLAALGLPLVGGTIHILADAVEGSRATLAPLGRLVGEPDFGPVSSAILAFGESAVFGAGLAWGLTRRTGAGRIHGNLT